MASEGSIVENEEAELKQNTHIDNNNSSDNIESNDGDASTDHQEAVDFDDDEEILKKFDDVNLTEDDTETLLEEAYAVNRKLKEILKQQDEAFQSSNRYTGMSRSAGSKHPVLPPIQNSRPSKQKSVYSAKITRTFQPHPTGKKSTSPPHPLSSSSQPKSARVKSSKSSPCSDKPEWNNRF